jgi:hypothetical protein
MKLIAFIIAFLLFALGVYFLIKADYVLASALMLTVIAFYSLINNAPSP